MTIPVTLLYGSLTALLLGLLGVNVSRMRVAKRAYVCTRCLKAGKVQKAV